MCAMNLGRQLPLQGKIGWEDLASSHTRDVCAGHPVQEHLLGTSWFLSRRFPREGLAVVSHKPCPMDGYQMIGALQLFSSCLLLAVQVSLPALHWRQQHGLVRLAQVLGEPWHDRGMRRSMRTHSVTASSSWNGFQAVFPASPWTQAELYPQFWWHLASGHVLGSYEAAERHKKWG